MYRFDRPGDPLYKNLPYMPSDDYIGCDLYANFYYDYSSKLCKPKTYFTSYIEKTNDPRHLVLLFEGEAPEYFAMLPKIIHFRKLGIYNPFKILPKIKMTTLMDEYNKK